MDGLDKVLFSGLSRPVRAEDVIEFYGEPGSGKTHLLLHLIANCILPPNWKGRLLGGRNVGVIYVDTEFNFSLLRLVDFLEHRITSCFSTQELPCATDRQAFIGSCLCRLIVAKCKSSEELLETLQSFDEILRNRNDICVMMIDAISAFYYQNTCEVNENDETGEKNQKRLVEILRLYISKYYLVVIATMPAIFVKNVKCFKRMDDYSYMCRQWREFVKYAYVVTRQSSNKITFLLKQVKPNIGDYVIHFAIHRGGLAL